jgi:hypothetical protein
VRRLWRIVEPVQGVKPDELDMRNWRELAGEDGETDDKTYCVNQHQAIKLLQSLRESNPTLQAHLLVSPGSTFISPSPSSSSSNHRGM